MELTHEQVLQQGVDAHKEGKLQEAERLYRIILRSHSSHPYANYNLGVIAISCNKADSALPLFKTALEANPQIEQFWISYIDALIKEKQFESALEVIKKGKKQGISKDKLNFLKAQLVPMPHTRNAIHEAPSQEKLRTLLECYQSGRFGDAEELALSITENYSKHEFGWKILGALYDQSGRKQEALDANQTLVKISPQDPEAHNNLGNTLKGLGRLEEAKASYTQAIVLSPNFALAHSNLGNALLEMGSLECSEASHRRAIALNPDSASAYSNFGATLRKCGKLEEAEASYMRAIELNPDSEVGHCNLGNTLRELGRLEESEKNLRQAVALNPDFTEAHYNLGVLYFESSRYKLAAAQFEITKTTDAYRDFANRDNCAIYAVKCSYLQDEETIFLDRFDLLVKQGMNNAAIGSLGVCSELKYGINRLNPFCNDPLAYILEADLKKICDFEKVFIQTAREVLTDHSLSFRAQQLLTNGVQTAGNFFAQGKESVSDIESIIRTEVEKYRSQFSSSDEGFMKSWPTSYEIKGWLVSMQKGGKLAPHIHDEGWISGSIYINVPPKSQPNCGNLVLSLNEQQHASEIDNNQQTMIDVVTGSLCLFPSSLYHYTVPFDENEDRVVLAFDIVPKIHRNVSGAEIDHV